MNTKLKAVGGGGFAVPEAPWVDKVLHCLEEPKVESRREAEQEAARPVGAAATFLIVSDLSAGEGAGKPLEDKKKTGSPQGGSPMGREAFV